MDNSVHVFKVKLAAAKSIWRRIAVRGSQTLDDLHEAIFRAFDRDDEHMYSFYFPPPGRKGPAACHGAPEYTHPLNAAGSADKRVHNAKKTPLSALGLWAGQTFLYLFDFGDQWWHEIGVEQIDAPDDEGRYPRLLQQKGDSPAQYPDAEE